MKKIIIAVLVIIVVGLGVYFLIPNSSEDFNVDENIILNESQVPLQTDGMNENNTAEEDEKDDSMVVIGKTIEGNNITAHKYGNGEKEILFVGGVHGGYEWNTVSLAYEAMDYLESNPVVVPDNMKVTIVPVLNPDGLNKVIGSPSRFELSGVPEVESETIPGRFNANDVDLNRNFDCDWKKTAKWQNKTVSGGDEAFSEPESQAIRDYIETEKPEAVVVWYSAAGGVFASNCHDGVLTETLKLTNVYADASGYPAYEEFNFYEITGDMVNWLAKEKIPAISVLLTNHTDIEWSKNKAGIKAILEYYTK